MGGIAQPARPGRDDVPETIRRSLAHRASW
jgi:hypothetical protein